MRGRLLQPFIARVRVVPVEPPSAGFAEGLRSTEAVATVANPAVGYALVDLHVEYVAASLAELPGDGVPVPTGVAASLRGP